MRFERNVNDEVIVKLTPEGERMYTMNAVYRDKLNNDSVYSFQIWELMLIFAEAMTFGDPKQVFVDNKLVFPESFDIFEQRIPAVEEYALKTTELPIKYVDSLERVH